VAEAAYALPGDAKCIFLARRCSHTYRVESGGESFVLRVWRRGWRTLDEIRSELLLLRHCAAQGAPVSAPLSRRDGELLTTLDAPEGRRYAALFRQSPGKSLDAELSAAAARSLGRATAVVHAACDSYSGLFVRQPLDVETLIAAPLRRLAGLIPERPQEIGELQELGALLAARLRDLPREPPIYGICHGDVAPGNAYITAEGHVEIFDFDFCGPGWRAYDLGSFLWEADCAGSPEAVGQAFLAGYEERRSLTEGERQAARVFAATCNIAFLGVRASLADEQGREALSDRLLAFHLAKVRSYIGTNF
jgi:Ser/Thr protein kinase RdoA (MazF antagonist)